MHQHHNPAKPDRIAATIPHTPAMGNTELSTALTAIDSDLLIWICEGSRVLDCINEMLNVIAETAASGHSNPNQALSRIDRLARLAALVAQDNSNSLDCCQERYREQRKDWGISG